MSKETSPQVGVMGLVSPVQIVQRLGIAEFGVGPLDGSKRHRFGAVLLPVERPVQRMGSS